LEHPGWGERDPEVRRLKALAGAAALLATESVLNIARHPQVMHRYGRFCASQVWQICRDTGSMDRAAAAVS